MKKLFRKDDEAVSPVIAVILMVAITVVLAGVLYVWVSGFGTTGGGSKPSVGVENPSEKSYGWTITISSVSGSTFNLGDAKFRLIDDANFRIEDDRDTTEVNPPAFVKGASKVFAIPSGSAAVTNAAGSTIGSGDSPQDYKNCSFAYIDQDDNGKVTAGDTIYVYKDNDNDGTDDILSGYVFELLFKTDMVVHKTL